MSEKAKITLTEKPEKSPSGLARLFKVKDQGDFWIPETYFFGYNPGNEDGPDYTNETNTYARSKDNDRFSTIEKY